MKTFGSSVYRDSLYEKCFVKKKRFVKKRFCKEGFVKKKKRKKMHESWAQMNRQEKNISHQITSAKKSGKCENS